jgi:hypothetical protein
MKTSELLDIALNWAVAICQNVEFDENNEPIWFDDDGAFASRTEYSPSTDWAQGGPTIERENIELGKTQTEWRAQRYDFPCVAYGPTPLIAAMRCYVTSKLGDEVDIPTERQ